MDGYPIDTPAPPYPRSWIDAAFDALERLPAPTWLVYVGLTVPSVLLASSALWLSGLKPWGDIDPEQAFWGAATIAILAACHYLRALAGRAFDAFRPALGNAVADPDRVRYEMTTMPARTIAVITVFSFVITPVYYVTDPVASQVVGVNGIGLVGRILSEGLTSTIVLAILVQSVRQARRIMWLHRVAEHVDPFRPAPLHAFSQLTAQAGIIVVLFNVAGIAANPAAIGSSVVWLYLPWLVGFGAGAVAVFVVPLLGMHGRLDEARRLLAAGAGERLRALVGELNEAIDARATERVDAIDRTIAALRREQELIDRLPTWPWSTGTFRGFVSALLLPLAVFVMQRALLAILPA
jgi:hypothetical protein